MKGAAASPHLHRDTDVDLRRVNAFLEATPEVRAKVLALLPGQAADDSTSCELALLTLTFSVISIMIAPASADFGNMDGIGRVIFGVFLGLVALAVVLPIAAPALVRSQRRKAAVVWLGAYEDALEARANEARSGGAVRLLIRRFLRL